eukprot:SAG22_NODE_2360_length_2666_cov_1.181924_4_plen_120_part_00
MRAGFYCMSYPARFGFEEALDVPHPDPSQPAPAPSARTEMVKAALLGTILPKHLAFFEKLLAKSPSGWLAGTARPTIADFYMDGSFTALATSFGALSACPGQQTATLLGRQLLSRCLAS